MLINCLLEDRVAVTGGGLSTTKQIVRYCYGEKAELVVERQGQILPPQPFTSAYIEEVSNQQDITQMEVRLPHPMLRHVELWDTPGFDAEERDDHLTEDAIRDHGDKIFTRILRF